MTFHPNSSQVGEASWFHAGLMLPCRRAEQSLCILVCRLSLIPSVQCLRRGGGSRSSDVWRGCHGCRPTPILRNRAVCQVWPHSSVRRVALKRDILDSRACNAWCCKSAHFPRIEVLWRVGSEIAECSVSSVMKATTVGNARRSVGRFHVGEHQRPAREFTSFANERILEITQGPSPDHMQQEPSSSTCSSNSG